MRLFPYCGSKKSKLKYILPLLEKQTGWSRIVEPFCGTGIVSYSTGKPAWLNDASPLIASVLLYTKKYPVHLAIKTSLFKKDKASFTDIKNSITFDHMESLDAAAKNLYYLNYCYRGKVALSKKGKLINTYGNGKNIDHLIRDGIREYTRWLDSCRITCGDYLKMLPYLTAEDIVYIDPPYLTIDKFYSSNKFSECDYKKLFQFCNDMSDKKIRFLLSANKNEFIGDLFKKYFIREVDVRRTLCNEKQKAKEFLISNFKQE